MIDPCLFGIKFWQSLVVCLLISPHIYAKPSDYLSQKELLWLDENHDSIYLIVVVDAPPASFLDEDGQIAGLLVDYFHEIESKLDIEIAYKPLSSWADLINHSKLDSNFIIVGITRTDTRAKYLSFTNAFTKVPHVIIAKDTSENLSMNDLEDKSICTVKGYAINEFLEQHFPHLSYKGLQDTLAGLRGLATGECEVMLADQLYASYLISDQNIYNLKIVGETGHRLRLSAAVSVKNPILFDIIDKTVDRISEARKQEISQKWISPNSYNEIRLLTWFPPIAGTFALFMILMWVWTTSLKRQVNRHLEKIRSTEDEFKSYVENAPNGMYVIDRAGWFIQVNPAFEKLTGYSRDELLNMNLSSLIDPRHFMKSRENFEEVFTHGKISADAIIKDKVGNSKYIAVSAVRIHDSLQLGFTTDITGEKRLEEEKNRLVLAMEQGSQGVLITNTKGRIEYTNRAFEQLSGYKREAMFGQTVEILQSLRHESTFYKNLDTSLRQGNSWQGRSYYTQQDGTVLTTSSSVTPIRGESGEVEYYVTVSQDISQQLVMEQEKAELETQYHHAQKIDSIGRLAGGIAHDLNNLLIPILCYGELLLGDNLSNDDVEEFALEVLKAGNRARDLISQLLAYTRNQTLEFNPIELQQVLKNMDTIIKTTVRENITIKSTAINQSSCILADVTRMEQVILNLVMNAADAMPEGGQIKIDIRSRYVTRMENIDHDNIEPGEYVMFTISDQGSGMDQETKQRMFEPFFSTKGNFGTGLGLASVHGIVKQHNGFIEVKSKQGKGTSIKVIFPAEKSAPMEITNSITHHLSRRGTETILLVEDMEDVRLLASNILQVNGYTVITASTGIEALELLHAHASTVQLLITDVIMPNMSGSQLSIEATRYQPDLKVIFMSGYSSDLLENVDTEEESFHFIQKPFSITSLTEKVRQVLS